MKYMFLLAIIFVIFTYGCERNSKTMKINLEEFKSVPQRNWESLAVKKIYFGHQSVGFNIIDGIAAITQELPNIKLNIQETKDPNSFNQPIFAHSRVGKNSNPISKCDDFKKIIESGIGNRVDMAFFKLCYVDFDSETDIPALFKYYTNTMSQLQTEYPRLKFIHFTVPLKTAPSGIKTMIKKILGRQVDDGNMQRNKFNRLLREKYAKQNVLFDLAFYESTSPDNKTPQTDTNLSTQLWNEYTDDGGHLNDMGKKIIAKRLLLFLKSENILDNQR